MLHSAFLIPAAAPRSRNAFPITDTELRLIASRRSSATAAPGKDASGALDLAGKGRPSAAALGPSRSSAHRRLGGGQAAAVWPRVHDGPNRRCESGQNLPEIERVMQLLQFTHAQLARMRWVRLIWNCKRSKPGVHRASKVPIARRHKLFRMLVRVQTAVVP